MWPREGSLLSNSVIDRCGAVVLLNKPMHHLHFFCLYGDKTSKNKVIFVRSEKTLSKLIAPITIRQQYLITI